MRIPRIVGNRLSPELSHLCSISDAHPKKMIRQPICLYSSTGKSILFHQLETRFTLQFHKSLFSSPVSSSPVSSPSSSLQDLFVAFKIYDPILCRNKKYHCPSLIPPSSTPLFRDSTLSIPFSPLTIHTVPFTFPVSTSRSRVSSCSNTTIVAPHFTSRCTFFVHDTTFQAEWVLLHIVLDRFPLDHLEDSSSYSVDLSLLTLVPFTSSLSSNI